MSWRFLFVICMLMCGCGESCENYDYDERGKHCYDSDTISRSPGPISPVNFIPYAVVAFVAVNAWLNKARGPGRTPGLLWRLYNRVAAYLGLLLAYTLIWFPVIAIVWTLWIIFRPHS